MGWVVKPRPGRFTPGKDPVHTVWDAGWAPGPVWTGVENLVPTGIRSRDRPARSESQYQLSYPDPLTLHRPNNLNFQGFNNHPFLTHISITHIILTEIITIFHFYGVMSTKLTTTLVRLYSCNNNIILKMAAITTETCW